MKKLLLIDDDRELCAMLADYLAAEGFEVTAVHEGPQGVEAALSGDHDLVVLDVMLPQLNGIEVLQRIRATSRIPVLMLTAKGDDVDRIVGLELGADDYLPKPYNVRELAARLRAIARRGRDSEDGPEVQRAGPAVVHLGERRATWGGEGLDLTSTEFNVLAVLVRNAGQVVSKMLLSEQAMGRPLEAYDRSIDMHVSHLRRKLGPLESGRSPIQTVRGQGYQFVTG